MKIRACANIDNNRPAIVLDGEWEFSFDAGKNAVKEQWFAPEVRLPEQTRVPGCPQAQPHKSLGHDLPRADADAKYRTIPYNMGTKGNMGTVIRAHPALDRFPHEGWRDFVFEPLITGADPFALVSFGPGKIKPLIQRF